MVPKTYNFVEVWDGRRGIDYVAFSHRPMATPGSATAMHPMGHTFALGAADGTIKQYAIREDPSHGGLYYAPGRYNYEDFSPLAGQSEPGRRWTDRAGFYRNRVALERPVTWRPYCGNGVLDEGERFDSGQPFDPSTEYHITCGATCGDGFVHEGEGCDDGNLAAGDGCSALCQVE
jgi:cysteine-rich repeat protein